MNDCVNYSIYFLNKLANSFNEESVLIDIFLQYNSGISINYNDNYKNTSFELTMLTIEQIKNHLIKILPKIIILYDFDDNRFSAYDTYNDVININSFLLFDENIKINNFDNYKYFSISLAYLLMHEVWSNAKISLKDKKSETPKKFNILSNNFKEIEIISIYNKNKCQLGNITEYIIKGIKPKDNDKNIFENYILNVCDNKEFLLDINLWNKNNFNDLRKLIKQNLKNAKEDLYNKKKKYYIKEALEEFPYIKI